MFNWCLTGVTGRASTLRKVVWYPVCAATVEPSLKWVSPLCFLLWFYLQNSHTWFNLSAPPASYYSNNGWKQPKLLERGVLLAKVCHRSLPSFFLSRWLLDSSLALTGFTKEKNILKVLIVVCWSKKSCSLWSELVWADTKTQSEPSPFWTWGVSTSTSFDFRVCVCFPRSLNASHSTLALIHTGNQLRVWWFFFLFVPFPPVCLQVRQMLRQAGRQNRSQQPYGPSPSSSPPHLLHYSYNDALNELIRVFFRWNWNLKQSGL